MPQVVAGVVADGTTPTLVHLMVEPSSRCNLRCPLCPTGSRSLSRKRPFLPENVFAAAVNEFVRLGGRKLSTWAYGEPFLHPRVFDMIRYASARGLSVRASTGGYLFSRRDWLAALLSSGLDLLIVSLDGADQATLEQYRVGADFSAIVSGLRQLSEARTSAGIDLRIELQFIVMHHNEHQIAEMRELAQDLGCDFVVKSVNIGMVQVASPEQWLPRNTQRSRYSIGLDGRASIAISPASVVSCFFIDTTLVLNSDGSVVPCIHDYYSDYQLGVFPEQSLADLWEGERLRELRQRFVESNLHRMCRNCPVVLMPTDRYKSKELAVLAALTRPHQSGS